MEPEMRNFFSDRAAASAMFALLRNVAQRAKLLGPQTKEDAVQETALRLLQASKGEGAIHAPDRFVSRTMRNYAIDEMRKLTVRGGSALPLHELDDATAPFTAPCQESAILLKQLILRLPPLYRDTFILNRFVGLTYDQIASLQGVAPKTVEYRMSRALQLCQEALQE
ncbi:MAG: hypothetical protein C0481_02745 [Phenylobacterium sp.]|nr:hypothetical protein [Phenylobacterium sp.]